MSHDLVIQGLQLLCQAEGHQAFVFDQQNACRSLWCLFRVKLHHGCVQWCTALDVVSMRGKRMWISVPSLRRTSNVPCNWSTRAVTTCSPKL